MAFDTRKISYMEAGKQFLAVGLGASLGGITHIMFLQPNLAGQQIIPGVQTTTLVDLLIGFVVTAITTVAGGTSITGKNLTTKLLGYGFAATMFATAIIQQFMPTPARLAVPRAVPRVGLSAIPRASVLAPVGVVVNKHGTVPEIAPGTFG